MRTGHLFLLVPFLATAAMAQGGDAPPGWAWPIYKGRPAPPAPADPTPLRLPGTKVRLTRAQTNDRFRVPDWRPGGHPPMPRIVANGRPPDVIACGYCHLPNGHGRPENAPIAGQPAAYIVEQVMEMKRGRRKSSVPQMGSIAAMMKVAAAVSPQDLKIAADYFSRVKYTKWIRVVETTFVPRTVISSHNMMVPASGGGRERLGRRIIETPVNLERTELRDPASGFIAYVPRGSIASGKALVESGAGAFPCAACHGAKLTGDGNVPGLAGRSPSYIMRQLYDFQHGTRTGPASDPMKPEVANLDADKRLDIAAYLASLNPSSP